MKSVICLALALAAVVAGQITEKIENAEENVETTSFPSTSSPFENNQETSETSSIGKGRSLSDNFVNNIFGSSSPVLSKTASGYSESTLNSASNNQQILSGGNAFGSYLKQYGSSVSTPFVSTSGSKNGQIYGLSSQNGIYGFNDLNNVLYSGQYGAANGANNALYSAGQYGSISGLNNGYNTANYGVGNSYYTSGYSLPSSYVTGYNTAVSGLQSKISHVDTQVRVDTTQQKQINTLHTITKQIPVPQPYPVPVQVVKTVQVPQPYPVKIEKAVPVPYKVAVPVPVEKPVPVKVSTPVAVPVRVNVPVPVEKPYPVPVEKTIQVPVEKIVYVRVPQPVAVQVPQPYPVKVHKTVPVAVPTPVIVKVPEYVHVHKHEYALAPTYAVQYGVQHHEAQYEGCGQHHQVLQHHEVPVSVGVSQFQSGNVIGQYDQVQGVANEISQNAYNDAIANQVEFANLEGAHSVSGAQYGSGNGGYQIQAAQLVAAYNEPVVSSVGQYGNLPYVTDEKYAYKRETAEKKEENVEKKN